MNVVVAFAAFFLAAVGSGAAHAVSASSAPREAAAPSSPLPVQFGSRAVCTREYAPVCGWRRGGVRTYPNACVARAAGARILYRGQCRGRR